MVVDATFVRRKETWSSPWRTMSVEWGIWERAKVVHSVGALRVGELVSGKEGKGDGEEGVVPGVEIGGYEEHWGGNWERD